jgi:hypothetical protein
MSRAGRMHAVAADLPAALTALTALAAGDAADGVE